MGAYFMHWAQISAKSHIKIQQQSEG